MFVILDLIELIRAQEREETWIWLRARGGEHVPLDKFSISIFRRREDEFPKAQEHAFATPIDLSQVHHQTTVALCELGQHRR